MKRFLATLALVASTTGLITAQDVGMTVTNGQVRLNLPMIPGVERFQILQGGSVEGSFQDVTGTLTGYGWTNGLNGDVSFYQVAVTPTPSNTVAVANLLNRIAYGPTPDELDRVLAMGPAAYLAEQLAPETINESLAIDTVNTNTGWQYFSQTGTLTAQDFYLYLSGRGDAYVDEVKVVAGSVAGVGPNLIQNGDFETDLTGWNVSTNHFASEVSTNFMHAGTGALHLIASAGGLTKASAIWQTVTPVVVGRVYTLSYWFHPGTNNFSRFYARFSFDGIRTGPETTVSKLRDGYADTDELRAWYVMHAVQSKKQLLEVMLQFLDNHFVTQTTKSREYFDPFYDEAGARQMATVLEYKELQRWRAALLRPNCTFHDLLKVSAESAAMIIYLDTVNSKGSGPSIANENYARELLELFTFGVDNGYDQNDITIMSQAWTGWSANIVHPTNEFRPFASRSTTLQPGAPNNAISNLFGVWTFNFKQANHHTGSKLIFPGKKVPARFGPPYAGRSYQLSIPGRTGTNGIQDGYQALTHLANQPFTQEFLSVKLCRLFVHEDFEIGYDFTDGETTPEEDLVRQCMAIWEQTGGQIRPILATILNSDPFRTQAGSMHKVRTPMEFTISAVRALRASRGNGSFTADTDGFSMKNPMERMGGMKLFDRGDPDGYPEGAASWISAGTLAERLRFVQSLLLAAGQTGKDDSGANNSTDPVGLLKMRLPAAQWNDAGAITDLFLKYLYPGEGRANLSQYRELAIGFLNTGDDGKVASPLTNIANTSPTYDTRIRGMVGMLMTLQRYQEQ